MAINTIYRVNVTYEPKHGADVWAMEQKALSSIQGFGYDRDETFSGNPAALPYIEVETNDERKAVLIEKALTSALLKLKARIV